MKYLVMIPKKVDKIICKMPKKAKATLFTLLDDLASTGPVQPRYQNYSKLGKDRYHCHLSYHWVACWHCENGKYEVEVYYVGSRESAPY